KNHPASCTNLVVIYTQGMGGAKNDEARTATYAKRACEGKNLKGCDALASFYLNGTGVPKDEKLAYSILDATCNLGDPQACVGLAQLTYQGVGTKADPPQAIELLRKACDKGAGAACRMLADAQATPHAPIPSGAVAPL